MYANIIHSLSSCQMWLGQTCILTLISAPHRHAAHTRHNCSFFKICLALFLSLTIFFKLKKTRGVQLFPKETIRSLKIQLFLKKILKYEYSLRADLWKFLVFSTQQLPLFKWECNWTHASRFKTLCVFKVRSKKKKGDFKNPHNQMIMEMYFTHKTTAKKSVIMAA